ncbi:MAG: potassium-transporting ATPase subunit F [Mucilaginibacter sp.]
MFVYMVYVLLKPEKF